MLKEKSVILTFACHHYCCLTLLHRDIEVNLGHRNQTTAATGSEPTSLALGLHVFLSPQMSSS